MKFKKQIERYICKSAEIMLLLFSVRAVAFINSALSSLAN